MRDLLAVCDGIFCGECGNYVKRGPFTVLVAQPDELRSDATIWLCAPCTEVFGLIIGHNYASRECPCNGDARAHGYLNTNGD